ncbi:hypothetical protein LC593_08355 [Nostoc sp. CHAB 5844]|nr:hypothetical protein [Nostoc sp. CHAB 5844]
MTVGKADDTCFNALNPRNAVSPQRTAHRNTLASSSRASRLRGFPPLCGLAWETLPVQLLSSVPLRLKKIYLTTETQRTHRSTH